MARRDTACASEPGTVEVTVVLRLLLMLGVAVNIIGGVLFVDAWSQTFPSGFLMVTACVMEVVGVLLLAVSQLEPR